MKRTTLLAGIAVMMAMPSFAQDVTTKPEEALFGEYAIGFSGERTLILEDANSPSGAERFRVVDDDGNELRRGMYLVADGVMYLTDLGGENACVVTAASRYAYDIDASGRLSLTQVADSCAGRREFLGAAAPLVADGDADTTAEAAAVPAADFAEG